MELINIKLQTTWNDAASSINSNFAKLLQAILSLEDSGGDTSGIDETQLAEYLINNGYTTEDWVKLQKYLKETDAAELYATIDSVEEIGGRVEALEKLNIKDMFYCVKNEDGEIVSIGTRYNFFSERSVAAKGLAQEGSGEEGEGGTTTGEYKMYKHIQSNPSAEWIILHGLGKYPNVKIVDTMKQLCFGDIIYESEDVVVVRFGAAESGVAYLD